MKKLLLKTTFLLCLSLFWGNTVNAQIFFSEDFQGVMGANGLPVGWTESGLATDGIYDVGDNIMANAGAYWPVPAHTLFAQSNDDVCNCDKSVDRLILPAQDFSTITGGLELISDFYMDGAYSATGFIEVSTDNGMTWTVVHTMTANPVAWQDNFVLPLNAYVGMSNVLISFRFNDQGAWSSGLAVDNVRLNEYVLASFDVAMSDPTGEEYTLVPLEQVTAIGTDGTISNIGSGTVTNANMTVNVYNGLMANVYTATSNTVASIAPAASATVTAPGYVPTAVDNYTVELISNISEVDGNLLNDTSYAYYTVTDSTYARDNGQIANLLGVGAGANALIGQNYELLATDTMTTVSFFVAPGAPGLGDSVSVEIYNTAGGTPSTMIGQSEVYFLTTADTVGAGSFITLGVTDLLSSPLILNPGTYYVAAKEYNTVDNMALAFSTDIFTPNTAWISINGGAFATSEALGFSGAYVVRPNFGPYVCTATGSTVTDAACNTYTWAQNSMTYTNSGMYYDTLVNALGCDSIVTLDLTINGPTSSTQTASSCSDYVWSVDSMTYTTTGMYTAVIPNAAGCDSTITLDLTIGALDITTSTATFTITANGTAVGYQWIDCGNGNAIIAGENGQSFTATANGDYAVILTDGACVDTSACVTIMGIGLNENTLSSGIEIFPNPSKGEFTIAISGIAADEMTVVITEANGKVVMTEELANVSESMELSVDLNGMETGVYFVTISANELKTVQRVVVTK